MDTKVCFITAIYGNYESTCKKFIEQTIPTDFICFTDNPEILSNGWIIDTTPYHLENKSSLDTDNYINSLSNNKHSFIESTNLNVDLFIISDSDKFFWSFSSFSLVFKHSIGFFDEFIFGFISRLDGAGLRYMAVFCVCCVCMYV
jgi:hypothetical protein